MKKPKQGRQRADQTTILLAASQHNSVLAELKNDDLNKVRYSAYGQRSAERDPAASVAFNGEFREPDTGWYLLGNGYRAYNPVLRRFHSPDSFSPFGSGGLNAYAYCVGDPINHSDPTGHFAFSLLLSPRLLLGIGGVGLLASLGTIVGAQFLPDDTRKTVTMVGAAALAISLGIAGVGVTWSRSIARLKLQGVEQRYLGSLNTTSRLQKTNWKLASANAELTAQLARTRGPIDARVGLPTQPVQGAQRSRQAATPVTAPARGSNANSSRPTSSSQATVGRRPTQRVQGTRRVVVERHPLSPANDIRGAQTRR